jgi:hypothetical protein
VLPVIFKFVPVGYEGYIKEHVLPKYCRIWGGFEDCVIGGANGSCHVIEEDNHSAVFTHYGNFVNQSYIQIFIKDMVALEAMPECCIESLRVCNLLGSGGINLVLVATSANTWLKLETCPCVPVLFSL